MDGTNDILQKLSKYYREVLKYVASSASKVLQNVAAGQRYGLVADLLLLVENKEQLENQTIRLHKPKKQLKIEKFKEAEDYEENDSEDEEEDITVTNNEIAWSAVNKIWRTQENNPFERETLIGQFILKANINKKNLLAPLLITQAEIIYNPADSTFIINKLLSKPDINRSLIATILAEDSLAPVRSEVNELFLSAEEINIGLIKKIVALIKNHTKILDNLEVFEEVISMNDLTEIKKDCYLSNTFVLINTPRTGSFILDDLDLLSQIDSDISGTPIEDLLTVNFEEDTSEWDKDKKSGNLKQNTYFFPLKSNVQQKKICDHVMENRLTVVWGPPGTGKSETISNLICHLIAHGKTVLVTSQQQKALEVVREKLRKNISLTSPNNPNLPIPLELALIKGEKESNIAEDLKNKLDALSVYTLGISSSYQLKQRLDSIRSNLNKCKENIDSLIKRFSELKLQEKTRYNSKDSPKKMHELREYDVLDFTENPYTDNLAIFSKDLKKMAELLCLLGPERKKYIQIFGKSQEESKKTTENIKKTLQRLQVFKSLWDKSLKEEKVVFEQLFFISPSTSEVRKLSQSINHSWEKLRKYYHEVLINKKESLPDFINFLTNLSDHKYEVLKKTLKKLQRAEEYISSFDLQLTEKFMKANYLELCENYELVLNTKPIWFLTNIFDKRAKDALQYCSELLNLRVVHWGKKELICRNINKLIKYIEANQILEKVKDNLLEEKIYLEGDSFKPEKITSLKNELEYMFELGTVLKDLSVYCPSKELSELLSKHVKNVNSFENITQLVDLFEKYEEEYINHKSFFVEFNIPSIDTTDIHRIDINSYEKQISDLLQLSLNFAAYVDLSYKMLVLPKSKISIIKAIENNNYILPKIFELPEHIIEYHRLARIYGSKNVQETTDLISKRIKIIEKDKRELIFDYILNKRLDVLYEASHSKKANSNLVRLRSLLGKKKKTLSFLKKKDSIDFSLVLNYFPCWIASIDDVSRYFPTTKGLFDYVIVDEASQCSQTAIPHLFYRAKNAIIVGDEKQLPNANLRFLQKGIMDSLQRKYNINTHEKAQFFDCKEYSLLGFAHAATPPLALIEHFRCDPTIIEWSNKHIYNNMMKIMTPIWERRFDPPMEVRYLPDGVENIDEKTNLVEAKAIIEELRELVSDESNKDLTMGVISPFRQQADLISDLLYKEIKPEVIKKFALQSRTVDGFQGDERDILLYSMRYSPNGKPGSITAIENGYNEEGFKRMNVAFTRARRKVVVFTSCKQSIFPGRHIKSFIAHAQHVQENYIDRLNSDNITDKFDSQFEENVCTLLRNKGLTVITQYPVAGYFIDQVILDREGRILAIECDGDFKFDETNELPAEHYERQSIIERVTGWDVFRIPSSIFYLNPEKTIDNIIETLHLQPTHTERKLNQINIEEKRVNSESNEESELEDDTILNIIESNPDVNSKTERNNLTDSPKRNLVDKDLWFSVAHWGKTSGLFSSFQNRFCYSLGQYITRKKNLTEKQKSYGEKLLQSAFSKGFIINSK